MVLLGKLYEFGKRGKVFPKRLYSQKDGSGKDDGDSGYMVRRLAQLAEESRPLKDDPNAGSQYFDDERIGDGKSREGGEKSSRSIIDEIYAKVEGSKYNYLHQTKIGYTKIPASAPKQAREIAESIPWSGKESIHDANLRMLVDAHKPLKSGGSGGGTVRPPKFNPPLKASERLFKARESTLDYTLNKQVGNDKSSIGEEGEVESGPTFKDMYKERLLGPSGVPSAFSAINSLAAQRIEDAIARGQFKDLPRGKPLEKDHHTSSPYIDTTEYFLNKIIQKQGAAPPWIEKQIKLNTNVEHFRKSLNERWERRAVFMVVNEAGIYNNERVKDSQVEKAIKIATQYSINEQNKTKYNVLRDNEWLQKELKYHQLMIADINNIIRGYNLQAPGSARKGYLDLQTELNLAYQTVAHTLPIVVKRYLVPDELPDSTPASISKDDLYKQTDLYIENPNNHYGLSHLFRDVVNKIWRR